MANKDFQDDKKQAPQAGQQNMGGRKNNEETGEPVQLPDDKQQGQKDKPGMGQREGHQGGQHQGGGQQGGGQQGQNR